MLRYIILFLFSTLFLTSALYTRPFDSNEPNARRPAPPPNHLVFKRPLFNKPIHIHIPFASGGATETLIKQILPSLQKELKVPIEIHTNQQRLKPQIFVHRFLSLPKNNTHFILGNLGTHATSEILQGINLKYNPLENFTPIAMLGQTPMYLLIRKNLCFQVKNDKCINYVDTLSELQRYMWQHKKAVTMGHAGEISTSYLAALHFNFIAKTNPTLIRYSGSKAALQDISNGFLDLMIDQSTSCLPYIKGNALNALAQTGSHHPNHTSTPNIKNFDHLIGWHEFNITGWNILFAHKQTPKPIINHLNLIIRNALKDPVTRGNLAMRSTLIPNDSQNKPNNLRNFIQSEIERWRDIISDSSQQ